MEYLTYACCSCVCSQYFHLDHYLTYRQKAWLGPGCSSLSHWPWNLELLIEQSLKYLPHFRPAAYKCRQYAVPVLEELTVWGLRI